MDSFRVLEPDTKHNVCFATTVSGGGTKPYPHYMRYSAHTHPETGGYYYCTRCPIAFDVPLRVMFLKLGE